MKIKKGEFVYKIVLMIYFFIYYQQVFVVNMGGSFKIYELLGVILVYIYIFDDKKVYSKYSLILFLFFVVAPFFSNIIYFFNNAKYLYYIRFPEAKGILRSNLIIAPLIIYVYYIFNWVTINYISGSYLVYVNKKKIIKTFIISGTIISIYSIYGVFFVNLLGFPDIIPSIVDFRNSKPEMQIRPAGFSIEPGTYILVLSWSMLYLIFFKSLFKRKIKRILILINGVVLFLTTSSLIVVFIFVMFLNILIFSNLKQKIKSIIIILIIFLGITFLVVKLNYQSLVRYALYYKIKEFITPPRTTINSGEFRNYTSRLGIEVFKRYPIFGVGSGCSNFFIWENEYKMGIVEFRERIGYNHVPQNSHAKILAELGLVGYTLIFLFFLLFLIDLYLKTKTGKEIYKITFLGTIMTFFMMFSIYPESSMFLWVNMALGINELYFSKKIRGKEKNEKNSN